MNANLPAASLSNDDLISQTSALVRRSCGVEAELLLHLGEIDERPRGEHPRSRPVVAPLSAETFKIQFTASRAFKDKLREAQDLLRHRVPDGDMEKILGAALELLVDKVKKERFGVGRKARHTVTGACATGSANEARTLQRTLERPGAPDGVVAASRHVPNATRRVVCERDEGRCAFVDERGRRKLCGLCGLCVWCSCCRSLRSAREDGKKGG